MRLIFKLGGFEESKLRSITSVMWVGLVQSGKGRKRIKTDLCCGRRNFASTLPLDSSCANSSLGLQRSPSAYPAEFGLVSPNNHMSWFLEIKWGLPPARTLLIMFLWGTLTNTWAKHYTKGKYIWSHLTLANSLFRRVLLFPFEKGIKRVREKAMNLSKVT